MSGKLVDDLEVLNEFHEAGDVGDEELDREYEKTAAQWRSWNSKKC